MFILSKYLPRVDKVYVSVRTLMTNDLQYFQYHRGKAERMRGGLDLVDLAKTGCPHALGGGGRVTRDELYKNRSSRKIDSQRK